MWLNENSDLRTIKSQKTPDLQHNDFAGIVYGCQRTGPDSFLHLTFELSHNLSTPGLLEPKAITSQGCREKQSIRRIAEFF